MHHNDGVYYLYSLISSCSVSSSSSANTIERQQYAQLHTLECDFGHVCGVKISFLFIHTMEKRVSSRVYHSRTILYAFTPTVFSVSSASVAATRQHAIANTATFNAFILLLFSRNERKLNLYVRFVSKVNRTRFIFCAMPQSKCGKSGTYDGSGAFAFARDQQNKKKENAIGWVRVSVRMCIPSNGSIFEI